MQYQEAYQYLEQRGQTQLLRFYEELTPVQQEKLLAQIPKIDFSVLELPSQEDTPRGKIAPLGACTIEEIEKHAERYQELGIRAIQNGEVGAVLLAGGQGSRLGHDGPKGTCNIGVTRELSIFECLFRNLMEVTEVAYKTVPLFIMTSESNDAETRAFLKEKQFFGYPEESVFFFIQDMAPIVNEEGKILLEEKDTVALSPNGNGGWFSSMQKCGLTQKIEEMGIQWLNVFAVDNVLQRIADPCFIGATIASGCTCGGKVVAKTNAGERVGVLCLEDGRPSIVEYYEMTEDMRNLTQPDGSLTYRYGVILNYLFRMDGLQQTLGKFLPLHKAHKKVNHIAEDGTPIIADKENAYKFETLVLDMIHMQENCLSYEVVREHEFAPIKNKEGVDSVESARELLAKHGIVL